VFSDGTEKQNVKLDCERKNIYLGGWKYGNIYWGFFLVTPFLFQKNSHQTSPHARNANSQFEGKKYVIIFENK